MRIEPKRIALMLAVTAASAAPAAAQWRNLSAPSSLAGAAPRTADGRPDLSGVWQADGQTYFFDLAAGLKPDDFICNENERDQPHLVGK